MKSGFGMCGIGCFGLIFSCRLYLRYIYRLPQFYYVIVWLAHFLFSALYNANNCIEKDYTCP